MKKILPLIIIGLRITLGCMDKRDPIITIVNIGHSDRLEIGRQLGIIKKYSPKVIALDFYLVPDSLDRDAILVQELEIIKNTVQVVALHDLYEPDYIWDSLEVSHPKFKIANHGFANFGVEDSVIINELPMMQTFNSRQIYCFGYVVAENSFGVRDKFKNTGDKELKLNLAGLGKNYKLITADQLFSGKFKEQDLKDKIVLMGYLGEKEDYFYLDKGKTKKVNGVEVHASIIEELIDL
ncbi:MAG TPA: CHASE2 domain-containing protein [Cyclobacteriaceae bacterium]|nr:CHASE2 domain-containing protein [Cyclobacteriaceae bacterium]